MAAYIDYSYKKIKELLTDKSKQNTDMKSYKERLEILIASFGTQIRGAQSKFGDYCKNCFKDYEKNSFIFNFSRITIFHFFKSRIFR